MFVNTSSFRNVYTDLETPFKEIFYLRVNYKNFFFCPLTTRCATRYILYCMQITC